MPPTFTERELDIMSVLWSRGPSTVAEVRAALGSDVTHNTVATMLGILEEKGHVRHVEEGRAFRYHPRVAREEAGRGAFSRLVDTIFDGSAEAMLSHFVRERHLSVDQLERIRAILDQRIEDAGKPNGRRKKP